MNEYTAIADYYDLLMTSGYYQYGKIANIISLTIQKDDNIIEIGVGSGLLLKKLLEIDPEYNLTGIDHTPEMIAIAKKRLPDNVQLFEADVIS